MAVRLQGFWKNQRVRMGLKLVLSAAIVLLVLQTFFFKGIDPYYTVEECAFQNDFVSGQTRPVADTTVSQRFVTNGNIISNLFLYVDNTASGTVDISLLAPNGDIARSASVNLDGCAAGAWNMIAFDCDGIQKGSEYTLTFSAPNGLESLLLDAGERPACFTECADSRDVLKESLVIGVQQTDVFITEADAFMLGFHFLTALLLLGALCYTVIRIEEIWRAFAASETKKALLYAIYFAAALVFLFNPIDADRTEVKSFDRTFGSGFINNVDVGRRVNNFSFWFIFFCAAAALFYLLVNYIKGKEHRGELEKAAAFLDQLMILANVDLLYRCIAYFADRADARLPFYYASCEIQLIVMLGAAYLVLRLDRRITAETYLKLEMSAFCASYPLAILLQWKWQSGKLLFGIQAALMLLMVPLLYWLGGFVKWERCSVLITAGTVCASMLPFATSFYIEFIHILNQHGIFAVRLRRYYAATVFILMAGAVLLSVCGKKKGFAFAGWKGWSYSWLVFGIACLYVQIPLEGIYGADLIETANSSVLISGFLNFGEIPLVQHYGGHMMMNVWEGLIYAVLNGDRAGAVFSPYSGYILPVLALLFFSVMRKVWDEDLALLTTLFFPFYNFFGYYGLGMLVCLAAWAYVRKNTWPGAALLWLAFIWCALYRLDLGASIGAALVLAMLVYVCTDRNWKAAKQLSAALAGWAVFGAALWFGLCFVKGIDPAGRLREFLLISLSNLNWAYAGIGDFQATLFSWCYIILPFTVGGTLLYTVVSGKFREGAGDVKWLLLLILGFSYFTNFSRGLVRHSLAEFTANEISSVSIVTWDAYLYLAVFVSAWRKKREWFLPVFALLILCSSALTTTLNYRAGTIAGGAASRIGDFTNTWTGSPTEGQTYWETLAEKGERAERVQWDDALQDAVRPYAALVNVLLQEDETYVDFTNTTFVYSAIGRRDPVYVSQSPLQLSGEFTQEMFAEEIRDIPIVLMPVNTRLLTSHLDGIPNAYRYYKVAEYIYQNYVPLCEYRGMFAVWCRPEKYEEYCERLQSVRRDYKGDIQALETLEQNHCESRMNRSGNLVLSYTGSDPYIRELQTVLDLSAYVGMDAWVNVEYDTDTSGPMQLYYTTDAGEGYSEEKSIVAEIAGKGTAEFVVPVTEAMRLRLDMPEKSTVKILSLTVGSPISLTGYGYDAPDIDRDDSGNPVYSYDKGLHTYALAWLPGIWAENDAAADHPVCCGLTEQDGMYVFDGSRAVLSGRGNYLHMRADYAGTDRGMRYRTDDETAQVQIRLGVCRNGRFTERYLYTFTVKEGCHDYLIRVSSDYNWYLGDINAVALSDGGVLSNVEMRILEGD